MSSYGFVVLDRDECLTLLATQRVGRVAVSTDHIAVMPVVFALFDGEESPRGSENFARDGMRGSRVAAEEYGDAEAMILLDFVGDRDLSIPREGNSDPDLWAQLRSAAKRAGHADHFPAGEVGAMLDDHVPFTDRGVPSIDLIDFTFACFHQRCDDRSAVSEGSLDATGETVLELLRSF